MPAIQRITRGTKVATTKPRSIIELVASEKYICWRFFWTPSASVFSLQATDPDGYSAPMPMLTRKGCSVHGQRIVKKPSESD